MAYQSAANNAAPSLPRITSNQEIMDALTPVPDFKSRDDIKPWVMEKMEPRGINLVIERSDASKVVFKCKNIHRKSTSTPRMMRNNSASSTKSSGKPSKRIRNVPEDSCPFRLRVSYSVKHRVWAVNVIKFDHNPYLCYNFGDNSPSSFSPSSTTPISGKRSWSSSVYTPASTMSPAFSSPAGSFTPASETSSYNGYDYLNADNVQFDMKKQRTSNTSNLNNGSYFDSPQEIDPLSDNLSLLPEDLSDINHFYESTQDINLINTLPLTNFDAPLDFNSYNAHEQQVEQEHFNQHLMMNQNIHTETSLILDEFEPPSLPSQRIKETKETKKVPASINTAPFKAPIQSKVKRVQPKPLKRQSPTSSTFFQKQKISPKPEYTSTQSILTEPLIMQQHYSNSGLQTHHESPNQADQLISNLQSVTELPNEEEDPLMYLLNVNGASNSNYTLEELENLDKAMGFDANDKVLMSIFQGM
jgi:hypothetical protein